MTETHEIYVTPSSRNENEKLQAIQAEFDERRNGGQAAVFGQLWVEGRVGKLKAHIFSGRAMEYLHRHVLKAIEIQNADEKGQEPT